MDVSSIQEIICENIGKLMITKLTYLTTQNMLQEILKKFITSDEVEIILIIADMNNVSKKIINHTRVLIEESEVNLAANNEIPKLFLLLLHFPALFGQHCYPTLYLKGWDHLYLDSIGHQQSKIIVDAENWLKSSWQDKFYTSDTFDLQDSVADATCSFLEPTIPILCSRIHFGQKTDTSFNSMMKNEQRSLSLKRLIFKYKIGDVLCEHFSSYWKPKVKLELLERIVSFSKQSQSTVSITESINTTIKSLFFDFCVYMITLINEDDNLDILFSELVSSPIHVVFKSIFKLFPLPKLTQINLMSKHFVSTEQCEVRFTFPFFKFVFELVEDIIQKCLKYTNLDTELLYGRNLRNTRADPESKLEQLVKDVEHKVQQLKEVNYSLYTYCL